MSKVCLIYSFRYTALLPSSGDTCHVWHIFLLYLFIMLVTPELNLEPFECYVYIASVYVGRWIVPVWQSQQNNYYATVILRHSGFKLFNINYLISQQYKHGN